jgi:hypothetical protein
MKIFDFGASIASGQHRQNIESICNWLPFQKLGPPDWISLDGSRTPEPLTKVAMLRAKQNCLAVWEATDSQISYSPKSDLTSFSIGNGFVDGPTSFAILEKLPFEVVALGSLFHNEWIEAEYPRWGFGRSHLSHGWGCAFRGAGHDRLVSRRWLDHGPWRVIRRDKDTNFIQFHDLDITDPAEAYEQAKVGHQRMGIAPDGGYIAWHYENLLTGAAKFPGLFTPINATKEIVVAPGIEVTQGQMICQTALRLHHNLTQPKSNRIRHVAYVFMDRADAEAHLHQLWLRELQCWYVDGSGKHRLDAGYKPTPNPPDWVKRLNARDGTK